MTKQPHDSRRRTRRPNLERLEPRCLLSASPVLELAVRDGSCQHSPAEGAAAGSAAELGCWQWRVESSVEGEMLVRPLADWPAAGAWSDLLRADLNGDGLDDIVAREQRSGQWWSQLSTGLGWASGQIGEWSAGVDWVDVLIADVNGDGLDDVAGRARGRWWVAVSDGRQLQNQRWGSWSEAVEWRDVRAGDVNGDGRDDLIGRANGHWWVALSDGQRFQNLRWATAAEAENGKDLLVADVNGDGRDDLVGRSGGQWWVQLSDGVRFHQGLWGAWSNEVEWEDVAVADVDGDGRDDIVGRARGRWWVAKSTGERFENERWGSWSDNVVWSNVSVADFDGDGREDVLGQASASGDWWVALSVGDKFENLKWMEGTIESQATVLVGDFSLSYTPYLEAAIEFFDTLAVDGVDRYGAAHSPMFASILDLQSRELPAQPPPLLPGQRSADRAYPGGNMQQDLLTLLAMYQVTQWSGQQRFAAAADAYLQYFLDNVASQSAGLFPTGEHAFWNFQEEAVVNAIHEELGFMPRVFLDHLWRLNPAALERHIRSLRNHIYDESRWYWNRHAPLDGTAATSIRAIPRHGGFYLFQWTYLHLKTGEAELLEWARRTAEVHWRQRHPVTGLAPYYVEGDVQRGDDPDKAVVILPHLLALGQAMLRANQMLGDQAEPLFDEIGQSYLLSALHAAPHAPSAGQIYLRVHADGTAYDGDQPDRYGFWDSRYSASGGYGFQGAEKFAIQMLNAHRLTGNDEFLQFAKGVCDHYESIEQPQQHVFTPGKYAGLLALSLDLHDLQGDESYLHRAQQLADQALDELYRNGLFAAATGVDYYEAANGPGALALELFRLHLALTNSDYQLPRNYWDP